MLVLEAAGSLEATEGLRTQLADLMVEAGAVQVETPSLAAEVTALWRWRDGVSGVVTSLRGGKVSEDVVVPVERLGDAVEATRQIGREHGLEAMSWGHAGDGNLHSTFLLDRTDAAQLERAHAAIDELFAAAVELGGTISGEHGVGLVKGGQLRRQWDPAAVGLHEALKRLFDPDDLLNPGKKLP